MALSNDIFWYRLEKACNNPSQWAEGETIDLKEMEPGVFRKAQPHEDIRHPDYYEALKDIEKTKNKRL